MAETPNEAIASIRTREEAVETIKALYGTFETEMGTEFLMQILREYQDKILNWLPVDVLIELARKHVYEEWKGFVPCDGRYLNER